MALKSARLLDGRELAQRLAGELKTEVQSLRQRTGSVPRLVNLLMGDDHGSCAYARSQKRIAEQIGIDYDFIYLPGSISQKDLISHLEQLNQDASVHGIMIHKPFPQQIDYHSAANMIAVGKDVEGINISNVGKMLLGQTKIVPCTPAAVMEHLKATDLKLRGKEAVVVGASDIVGKPLALLLIREFATVTVCHIATSEAGRLQDHVARADILIVAVGKAGLIKGDWIKPGAVVIDVGINKQGERIVGDVEFETAQRRASFITPVPGGVGPVTVVMLMRNGLEAFKIQQGLSGVEKGL